jgi:MFS family permease
VVAAAAIFTIFIWYERRRESSPLIELGLFAKRAFSGGLLVISTYFAGVMGFMLVFGLYTQLGLGYSPLRAGLTLTPWALGTAVGAALSGAVLGPRYGRRVIHSGLLVGAAGLLGVYGTLWHFGTRTGVWQLAPAVALAGLGMGLIIAPLFDVILTGVDDHEVGTASGVLNAMQQLGGAVGIAVLGTVFFSLLGSHPGAASGDPAGTAAVATQFTSAVQRTTLVVVGLFLLTFAAAFLLPRRGPASATHDGEQDGGHAGADD